MRSGGGFPEVKAKDYWLEQVRLGRAFAAQDSVAGGVGTNGHLQLWNPPGSAVRVLVRMVSLGISVAGAAYLSLYNTAISIPDAQGVNLLSGGAAGVALLREEAVAGPLGTLLWAHQVPAVTPVWVQEPWICELAAGQGFMAVGDANVSLSASFWWLEV